MMVTHKRKRSSSQFSARDKCEAIQRIRLGESKAAVARSIDVPESTLRGWVKREEKLRSLAFAVYSDYRDKTISQKNSPVDNGTSHTTGEPLNKINKLDTSPKTSPHYAPNGISKFDDTVIKQEPSDVVDLSSYKKSEAIFQNVGMNHTGDKTTSDISPNDQIKYEDNKHRSYGADVKVNNKNSPVLSMTAVCPLTSLNGISSKGQLPLGMSYQEIATNLNLKAQLNNQSNFTRAPGLINAEQNGLRSSMSQSMSLSGQSNSQVNDLTMDKIGMKGVNDYMKTSSVASLAYDNSQYWRPNHQQMVSNHLHPYTTPRSSLFEQQQIQMMLPSTTSIQPLQSSTPRKTSSTQSIDDVNSARFMQWCKYNQLFSDMMSEKTTGNGITHNSAKQIYSTKEMNFTTPTNSKSYFNFSKLPEEVSKLNSRYNPVTQSIKTETEYTVSSSTLSPIPPLVEISDRKEVIMYSGASSSTISPIPPLVEISDKKEVIMSNDASNDTNNTNNSSEKDDGMNGSDSALIGPSEAVKYGEKFLKWFEAYSDPTITTQDLLQFQRLLHKIKKIAERGNSPSFVSSKNRRRK